MSTSILSFEDCLRDRASFENSSRRAAKAVYIGGGVSLCKVANRFKMYVPTQDLSLTPHLMLEGYWEPWISVAISRVIKKVAPKNILNIGANLGYYTFLAAALLPNAKIIAYEPQPNLVELIRRSAIVNGFGNVTVNQKALGSAPGSAWLRKFGNFFGSAMIADDASAIGENAISVEISSLDCDGATPLEFLVIDAEGYEFEILRGAEKRIGNSEKITILMEFSASRYSDKLEFIEWLQEREFVPFRIGYDSKIVKSTYDELRSAENVVDLIVARGFHDDCFLGLDSDLEK